MMTTPILRNALAAVRRARGDTAISRGIGLSVNEILMVADLLHAGDADSVAVARPFVESMCRWNRDTCAAAGAGVGGRARRRKMRR